VPPKDITSRLALLRQPAASTAEFAGKRTVIDMDAPACGYEWIDNGGRQQMKRTIQFFLIGTVLNSGQAFSLSPAVVPATAGITAGKPLKATEYDFAYNAYPDHCEWT